MNNGFDSPRRTVRVVTDSVACLPQHLVHQYGMYIIPVRIAVDGVTYQDRDEELDASLIRKLQQAPAIDTTPWTPDTYCHEYLEAGRSSTELVHVVAFSQFTSTISLARTGADMAQHIRPELRIQVFDSASTAMAQGFVALAAARTAAEGGTVEDVIAEAGRVRSSVESAFTLDSLRYVARTGRVTRLMAWASTLLSVRAVVGLSQGKERPIALARSAAQAANRLFELVRASSANGGTLHVAVMDSGDTRQSEPLRRTIEEQLHPAECIAAQVSAVTRVIAGPGLLGVAYYVSGGPVSAPSA